MKRLAALVVVVLIGVSAGVAGAANPFTDIAGNTHANNIDAIYNAGITAGCTTGPTFYCPNDAVTRAQMASFLARGLGLSSGTSKNFPKANARGDMQAYCSVAKANPASYPQGGCNGYAFGFPNVAQPPESTTFVLDANGLPTFASRNDIGTVSVNVCPDFLCSFVQPVDIDDGAYNVLAMQVRSSGAPLVLYGIADGFSESSLFAFDCVTPDCTPGLRRNVATFVNNGAPFVNGSIAIAGDNNPLFFYRYGSSAFYSRCTAADCTTVAGPILLASPAADLAAVTGADGRAVIAYTDTTNNDLVILRCTDFTCGTRSITTLSDAGSAAALAIGVDGFPIVAYRDAATSALAVAHCTNVGCSTRTIESVTTPAGGGLTPTVAIGLDGAPVVVHESPSGIHVTDCRDVACDTWDSHLLTNQTGSHKSIVIGPDGVPNIYFFAMGRLWLARPPMS